jgi:hypothetical protein
MATDELQTGDNPHQMQSWKDLDCGDIADGGKHGLWMRIGTKHMVPVKVGRDRRIIGDGSAVHIDNMPKCELSRLSKENIAAIPDSHRLPKITSVVDVLRRKINKIFGRGNM